MNPTAPKAANRNSKDEENSAIWPNTDTPTVVAGDTSATWEVNERIDDEMKTQAAAIDRWSTELTGWESTALRFASENTELKKELGNLRVRIGEYERVRHRLEDFKSQVEGVRALQSLPTHLPDILRTIETLFPHRIEVSQQAVSTAEAYAKSEAFWRRPEGLSLGWQMVFAAATRLYESFFTRQSQRIEEDFGESFSQFSLAMTEGKQTNKDAQLMALRQIQHFGNTYNITPHIKFGIKRPKMLRLHFAIKHSEAKLLIGHFGDHLETYTMKKA